MKISSVTSCTKEENGDGDFMADKVRKKRGVATIHVKCAIRGGPNGFDPENATLMLPPYRGRCINEIFLKFKQWNMLL